MSAMLVEKFNNIFPDIKVRDWHLMDSTSIILWIINGPMIIFSYRDENNWCISPYKGWREKQ